MTYNELLKRKAEIVAAIAELKDAEKEIDNRLEAAKQSKAFSIFENIQKELAEMAELGYTISAHVREAEGWNDWHELGMSLLAIELTSSDQYEAILEALKR